MRTAKGILLLLLLCFVAISCSTIPRQKSGKALLIIPWESAGNPARLTLQGEKDTSLKIGSGSDGFTALSLSPGEYTIDRPDYRRTIALEPDTVVLLDRKIIIDDSGNTHSKTLSVEDRQNLAEKLTLYYDYFPWATSELVGFDQYRPGSQLMAEFYDLELNSDPVDADIYLDDQWMGRSPMKLKLPEGRYSLMMKKEGYENQSRIFQVNQGQEIAFSLEELESTGMVEDLYTLVATPFLNEGDDGEDQIGRIFAQSLSQSLESDSRLDLLPVQDLHWIRKGTLAIPDWEQLEQQGVELLLTGNYRIEGGQLIVVAFLYDVSGETVKTSLFFTGQAGLEIYDAIDQMTQEFAAQVDRVLPEAGKVLVEQKELVYSGLSGDEQLLLRYFQISRRQDSPGVLTMDIGVHGADGDDSPVNRGDQDGPSLLATFKYDRQLRDQFSLGGIFRMDATSLMDGHFTGTAGINPLLLFPSHTNDIYLGFPLSAYLASPTSFTYDNEGVSTTLDKGWTVGVTSHLLLGLRNYISPTPDKKNWFWEANLMMGLAGWAVDLSTNNGDFIYFDLDLNIGAGYRL